MDREIVLNNYRLRPVHIDEVERLHEIMTEEPVRRFLWDGEIIPFSQTHEIIEKSNSLFEENNYGLWGIHLSEIDNLLGFIGFWHFRSPPVLELVYAVTLEYWNQGIATMSVELMIQYGFEVLELSKINASTDTGNLGSIRVLEKVGMNYLRRDVVDGLDTVFYELKREDW